VARLALPPEKAAGMFAPRKWTHEDDERLQELRAAGKRPIAIGKELRRSEPAIIQRVAILIARSKAASVGGLFHLRRCLSKAEPNSRLIVDRHGQVFPRPDYISRRRIDRRILLCFHPLGRLVAAPNRVGHDALYRQRCWRTALMIVVAIRGVQY
jgi:hypothetical protein